jgi:hypothetical protein
VKITKTRTFAKDHLLPPVFQQLMTMTLAVHSLDKLGHVGYVEAKSPLSMPSMAKRLDAGSTFPCLYVPHQTFGRRDDDDYDDDDAAEKQCEEKRS